MSTNIQQPPRKRASLINHPPQPYVGHLPTRPLATEPLPQRQHVPNKSRIVRTSQSGKTVSFPFRVVILLALSVIILLVDHQVETRGHAAGNTVMFTPTVIPISNPELVNAMRGGYPYDSDMKPSTWPILDSYTRFDWADFETSQGVYNWTWFENELAAAKARGGRLGFRIMAADSSRGGNSAAVPQYLVNEMPKGFWFTYPGNSYQTYAPDWNDPNFLSRTQALVTAIANKYGNDPRLGWVEIGNYGDWSEWHVWQYPYDNTPYGPSPTGASDMTLANKQAIIQMYINAFPNKQILMLIDEAGVIAWVMQNYPKVGLRRDCLGYPDFISQYMQPYLSSFQNRWKTAPWITETCYMNSGSGALSLALSQITQYHVAMVGGYNMQSYSTLTASEQTTLQQMYNATGYRIILDSLAIPSSITPGSSFSVSTNWSNVGSTPAYTPWNIMLQLRDSNNTTVWQGKSTLDLQTLLPTNSSGTDIPIPVNDSFTLPATVPVGNYVLSVQITDANNYYAPLNLAINGRTSDGSYVLGTVTVGNQNSSTTPIPTNTPIPTFTPTPTLTPTPILTNTPTPTPTSQQIPHITPPTVTITSPLNGSTVSPHSHVKITVSASDNVGVTQVSYSINGSLLCTTTVSPYVCSWSVPGKPNASYTITAKAYDAAGNTATNTVTVTAKYLNFAIRRIKNRF